MRLDESELDTDAVAVSQSGEQRSAFQLGYESSNGTWVFRFSSDDEPVTGAEVWSGVHSTSPARPGEWTHLAGVYDYTRKEMVLYVDSFMAARASVDHAWHAEGGLLIGAAQIQGANGRYWPGDIDDVHAYQGALGYFGVITVRNGLFPNIRG